MKYILPLAIAAVGMSACSPISREQALTSFFNEAGAQIDTGDFGEATRANRLVQSGQEEYTINLARRFAADVNSTVNFEFNSAVLDEQARNTLIRQADWIRQFPEVRFKVYGHTDAVGSQGYNRTLGLRRAQAVVAFLTTQGIDRSRLEAVVSFGETQPIVVTDGRERRNRRTVTEVSGFVETDPLVLDGKYAAIVYRDYIGSAGLAGQVTEAAAPG